jgi:hypothetical protein
MIETIVSLKGCLKIKFNKTICSDITCRGATTNLSQARPIFYCTVVVSYKTVSYIHGKIVSSNTSHLEAHAGFFRLFMKGILDPYVLCDLLTNFLISNAH